MKKHHNPKIAQTLAIAIKHHQCGETVHAVALYKKVLRRVPTHPDALHYLGLAYHHLGDSKLAIKHIERAIAVSPNYFDALNNLGNIFKEIGLLDRALEVYNNLIALAPQHGDARVNIAIVLNEKHCYKQAFEHLQKAIEINPEHPQAHYNLGKIYKQLEQLALALASFRQSMRLDPINHEAVKNTAQILYDLGRGDEALKILNQFACDYPNDPVAKHMLASFSGKNVPKRADNLYVKQTFDAFSASFDSSLARLQYKAPQLISNCLANTLNEKKSTVDILDIGCGTGLCGELVKPLATTLIGVDLSPKMLEKARQLKIYDELIEAELSDYMSTCQLRFDYVICADTFVYFGTLESALAAAFKILRTDGYLIFTTEQNTLNDQDYQLQLHGRYCHSKDYLYRSLIDAGYEVGSISEIVPRIEDGAPVDGFLVSAKKNGCLE